MVHTVSNNFLELNRLYSSNIIDYLNFLSYQKDKENFKKEGDGRE